MKTVKRRLVRAGLAAATVLCVTAAVPTVSLAWLEAAREQRETIQRRIDAIELVQKLLVDAETGQRGFVITGDERFLEPYLASLTALPKALDDVAHQPGDDTTRLQLAQRLVQHVRQKRESLVTSVEARRTGGFLAAQSIVASGVGKQHMDEVRQVVRQLVDLDENALTSMDKAQTRQGYWAIGLSLTSALVVFGLFGFTGRWMWRAILDRETATTEAQEVSDKLSRGMASLEALNGEMRALSEMSNLLQTEMSLAEALGVGAKYCSILMPDTQGAVYLFRNSADLLVRSAVWGCSDALVDQTMPELLEPRACWGLRRGRVHVTHQEDGMPCDHTVQSKAADGTASVCLPLMAYGEVLGLLYVRTGAVADLDGVQRIARTVGEHVSLSLSNVKLRQVLRDQSIKDPLTGLFNRRYLEETLAREVARAQRTNTPLAVIVADLDHFKRINDTHGHPAGDAVLRDAAHALQRQIRASDLACRFGGEEFVLLLPDCPPDAAYLKARELCDALRAVVCHEGGAAISISGSFGVATFPADATEGAQLLKQADLALYQAKRRGRDQVCTAADTRSGHRLAA